VLVDRVSRRARFRGSLARMSAPVLPSRDAVRAWFPSLRSGFAYLENAGGAQVPGVVADAIRDYMLTTYVQLGAGYPQSDRATQLVHDAHTFVERLVNAGTAGKVVLGPSMTALSTILANAYADVLRPGDEVIVAQTNHEANAGPWARLARRGVTVKTWRVDRASFQCPLGDLAGLLGPRTRIVALPHVSNLLGEIAPLAEVTRLAHEAGARVVADGVAFAPHRAIDVQALGVDYYLYSTYKVFGPHMGVMFGRSEAFAEIEGPNHFFIARDDVPYKFELGGVSHEGCAGLLALRPYLKMLAGAAECDRAAVERAFSVMTALEEPLTARLLDHLRSRADVTIIGSPHAGEARVGTVSFVHARIPSPEIAAAVNREGIGIRYGHMYAIRLCEGLGIDPATGVVRVSLLHYNTEEEIERLIGVLDRVMGG
jgi:cysteine desulfurase family protein (TIGR01976 family)